MFSDVSFVLDSSKKYYAYRTQIDSELENFKNKQSVVDSEKTLKSIYKKIHAFMREFLF